MLLTTGAVAAICDGIRHVPGRFLLFLRYLHRIVSHLVHQAMIESAMMPMIDAIMPKARIIRATMTSMSVKPRLPRGLIVTDTPYFGVQVPAFIFPRVILVLDTATQSIAAPKLENAECDRLLVVTASGYSENPCRQSSRCSGQEHRSSNGVLYSSSPDRDGWTGGFDGIIRRIAIVISYFVRGDVGMGDAGMLAPVPHHTPDTTLLP